ncbi:LysR substrate-binding domain-containing protein [Sinorhizobium alkalisoli]|uniref:LysR substrate-binding domain-containing protein n=1 Tax=Sinorhizobium alkalisoli TaxID=1752398 RepID=UPI00124C050E|nr:LysR substrate-binding domain-containing protein [Sinorhizobium alkalisoli]QFI69157.1 Transcriptional regulator, LysR family [Sinorhizobium alkalisoli]
MAKGNPSLPPLDYLLAFEAAAEYQSFVSASKKLNISETAISRKVRLLELHYDVPLFHRGPRSIILTAQGISFLSQIQPALQTLRDASRKIIAEYQDKPVKLAATNSVASLWLMPRLQEFNRANKHVRIMLVASDNDEECLSESVDLAILRGDGNWPGYDSQLLFDESIFPICSPDYLEANPTARDLSSLSGLDLIEVSSNHTEWMNWKAWLAKAGHAATELEQAVVFNTYSHSIQAAIDGLGIALGWRHLVDSFLDQGKLVRPQGDLNICTEHGYYLLRSQKAEPFDAGKAVQDWLMRESQPRNSELPSQELDSTNITTRSKIVT